MISKVDLGADPGKEAEALVGANTGGDFVDSAVGKQTQGADTCT